MITQLEAKQTGEAGSRKSGGPALPHPWLSLLILPSHGPRSVHLSLSPAPVTWIDPAQAQSPRGHLAASFPDFQTAAPLAVCLPVPWRDPFCLFCKRPPSPCLKPATAPQTHSRSSLRPLTSSLAICPHCGFNSGLSKGDLQSLLLSPPL